MAKRNAVTLHVVTTTQPSQSESPPTGSSSARGEAPPSPRRRKPDAPKTPEPAESPPTKKPVAPARAAVSRKPSKPAARVRAGKSGLDIVADVLRKSGKPLRIAEITKGVLKAGWKTSGKTPGATLVSAMLREMKEKGKESRFKKAGVGLFTLTRAAARK